ncbi:protein of unknown function [Maridesulfovibrio hydrothermalis AM13 = DSM 14728]|uniref:Uncharacterized protein n=1 Tax=Maridesulfovibrio hydrothermalis AM13 = DSM 14728 TaxID=1121451 RepID=L0RCM9_9BACT|nr:protein of unknown function [Maridesulfovibrio hydrothermalis AM13 = DSM 14728]
MKVKRNNLLTNDSKTEQDIQIIPTCLEIEQKTAAACNYKQRPFLF